MKHVDFENLAAYWLGELVDDEIEEHLFACGQCAAQLEWLAALSEGVRAAVRRGAFGMAVSAPFVEAMKRAGMRLREYRADAGATVHCTMRADEDAVVSRIRAPLAGVGRIDVLQKLELGGVQHPEVRLEDVAFDPASGEVLILQPSAKLKKMPEHTMRVRLLAVEEKGERTLGEYTFAHTPG